MNRKQTKDVYKVIDEYIKSKSVIDSNELTEFVQKVIDEPESNELLTDYCRKIASNRIRQIRDKDGLRSFFSNGDKAKPKYVNVEIATKEELTYLHHALEVQEQQRAKLDRNIKKLRGRATMIEGQITLDEIMANENEDLIKAAFM